MSEQFVGTPDPKGQYAPLAQWLHQLLAAMPQIAASEQIPVGEDVSRSGKDYHAAFYPQIPNFAMALLKHDPGATTHYAPLLFHLIGCSSCHRAYLEIYDALRATQADAARPSTTSLRLPSSADIAVTPPKLLVLLCQLLIEQARAALCQARREHGEQDVWARFFLQQAMQVSRHIMQRTLRQRALRDLVDVASLYTTTTAEEAIPPGPAALSYATFVGSGSGTRGRTMRRADMRSRSVEQARIDLRAEALEGHVTQQDDQLLLHLVDLDESLRGKPLLISLPLGTLLEPVRWLGGNPYAIRSTGPVNADGTLTTPLGKTDLCLSNPEDRNLLEILFKKLEVRVAM
jgi:hypothetical protein